MRTFPPSAACRLYRTPGADWLFNTNQRNDGSELADAGLNVDSWGGAMGIPKRTCIGAAAATPAAATAPAADAADAAPAPA
jgi:hypothetical protein